MFKIILPSLNLKVERWKWNKDFRIYVSNLGHFKDEHKKDMPIKLHNGYCMIKTPYGTKSAHRLVMLTWKPIPNAEDFTVDHLDHNRRKNELSNLEWVTYEENQKRAEEDLIIVAEKEFKTITEAIDYAILMQNMINVKRKNVEKRILKAIETNTAYCNIKWKIKEEN